MTLEEANPKFLKIKKKIEILIELLKTNEIYRSIAISQLGEEAVNHE